MLESLRRRDEKPKDVPPALPARPTSRARLPSARRSLPVNFKIANKRPEYLFNDSGRDEKKELGPAIEKESGFEGAILGSKKLKAEPPVESPYVRMAEMETCEERLEEPEDLDSGAVTSSSPPLIQERGWDDNVGYVLKKKPRCSLASLLLVIRQRKVHFSTLSLSPMIVNYLFLPLFPIPSTSKDVNHRFSVLGHGYATYQ